MQTYRTEILETCMMPESLPQSCEKSCSDKTPGMATHREGLCRFCSTTLRFVEADSAVSVYFLLLVFSIELHPLLKCEHVCSILRNSSTIVAIRICLFCLQNIGKNNEIIWNCSHFMWQEANLVDKRG